MFAKHDQLKMLARVRFSHSPLWRVARYWFARLVWKARPILSRWAFDSLALRSGNRCCLDGNTIRIRGWIIKLSRGSNPPISVLQVYPNGRESRCQCGNLRVRVPLPAFATFVQRQDSEPVPRRRQFDSVRWLASEV